MSNTDKTNNHQQSAMIQNYHSNHLDYRNGSQMSFYDNQPTQQQQKYATDDELHRQHYFSSSDRQKTDTMHSSSDGSAKSEHQMSNIYHQQNGYLMKAKNQPANNNEFESPTDDRIHHRSSKKVNQYGKILNCNRSEKLTSKDHRNGSRPIPMLPSPPSTPPPPLNAKIKDYHESSNKFYQECQSRVHFSNQHRFNGNVNNNNEVKYAVQCIRHYNVFFCFFSFRFIEISLHRCTSMFKFMCVRFFLLSFYSIHTDGLDE